MVTLRVNTTNQGLTILAMGATGTMQELRESLPEPFGLCLWG